MAVQFVYTVSTMQISIKQARQRFSELINTVALKRERIIITSRSKPKAMIISIQDAEALESDTVKKAQRRTQLESIKKLRRKLAQKGVQGDSLGMLQRLREERVEYLSDDH